MPRATTDAQTTNITYDGTWVHLARDHRRAGPELQHHLRFLSGNLTFVSATDKTTQSVPYSTDGTNPHLDLYLERHRPAPDRAAAAHGCDGEDHLRLYRRHADQHRPTRSATPPASIAYQSGGRPLTVHGPERRGDGLRLDNAGMAVVLDALRLAPATSSPATTYDSAGNLTKTTLPDSSYLSYAYNDAHRLTTVTNALSESQRHHLRLARGDVTQTLWKNAGGTTKRQHTATFDALGRMLTDVGGESQTTTFTYDNNGNVQTITDPNGNISYRSVDALNRLTRTEDAELNISTITYDSHSRPLTVTDPKSNVTTYVYDGFGDRIQQASPDSGNTVYLLRPRLQRHRNSSTPQRNEADMTYDALDRMLTRTYPADIHLNVAFTYDQSGPRRRHRAPDQRRPTRWAP